MTGDINYKKTTKILFDFLLLAVIVITILPLFKIGLVAADDMENYLTTDVSSWGRNASFLAHLTGRFYFILVRWIYFIPYLFDNQIYYHLMRVIPLVVGAILLFTLIKRAGYDKSLVLMGVLLFCSSFHLAGAGSSVTSYPLFFSLAIILILISLHLLVSYYKRGKYYYVVLSSLAMAFASLFQESFLMYYILIFTLVISHYKLNTLFKKENLTRFLKEIGPFVLFGIAYLVAYITYAKLHPSQYSGNQINDDASFFGSIQLLIKLLVDSAPLSSFLKYRFSLITHSESLSTNYSLWFYLKEAGALAYLKSFIIVLLYLFVIKHLPHTTNRKRVLSLMGLGLLAAILPEIPMLFSVKANTALRDVYVTSYFSFLGIIVFLTAFLYLIIFSLREKRTAFIISNIVVGSSLFLFSLLTQYSNEFIARDINISQERFLILKDMKEPSGLKNGDIVCTQSMYQTKTISGPGITAQKASNIGSLLSRRHGIRIKEYRNYKEFYEKFHTTEDSVTLLFYAQAVKSYDTHVALMKCKGNELTPNIKDIRTNNMTIAYRSPYKKFSVSVASENNTKIKIDKSQMIAFGSMNVANIHYFSQESTVIFRLQGKGICPASLSISNMTNPYANNIRIGKYDSRLEKAYSRQNAKMILRNKEWRNMIEEKAAQRDTTFESVLKGDATWLIYN